MDHLDFETIACEEAADRFQPMPDTSQRYDIEDLEACGIFPIPDQDCQASELHHDAILLAEEAALLSSVDPSCESMENGFSFKVRESLEEILNREWAANESKWLILAFPPGHRTEEGGRSLDWPMELDVTHNPPAWTAYLGTEFGHRWDAQAVALVMPLPNLLKENKRLIVGILAIKDQPGPVMLVKSSEGAPQPADFSKELHLAALMPKMPWMHKNLIFNSLESSEARVFADPDDEESLVEAVKQLMAKKPEGWLYGFVIDRTVPVQRVGSNDCTGPMRAAAKVVARASKARATICVHCYDAGTYEACQDGHTKSEFKAKKPFIVGVVISDRFGMRVIGTHDGNRFTVTDTTSKLDSDISLAGALMIDQSVPPAGLGGRDSDGVSKVVTLDGKRRRNKNNK
jgi:hypothetical protein